MPTVTLVSAGRPRVRAVQVIDFHDRPLYSRLSCCMREERLGLGATGGLPGIRVR